MTTISERLRATGGKGQGGPLKAEAADTIDALVAALAGYDAMFFGITPDANTQTQEEMEATRDAIISAGRAALALARK